MKLSRLVTRTQEFVGTYVDAEERRLGTQAVVVGVVVWLAVFLLKLVVHSGFDWLIELIDQAPTFIVVLLPLALGALLVAAIAGSFRVVLHYRDGDGKVHALNAVEGDGLERAISLYFSAEAEPERALLGEQGTEVRWRLPTFTLALRKMAATAVTLCTGGSGGLEASVALVGESVAAGLFKPRAAIEAANEKLGRFSGLWRWWASTDPTSLQAAQLCGISAAIATLIGAPFAAAFFAVEVMYRRRPIIDRLIYALISALVAFFLTHLATGATPTFDLGGAPPPPLYEPRYYLALLVVTVTVAVVARAFREGSKRLDGLFSRVRTGYARHLLGALLTGVIAITAVLAIRSLGLTTPSQPLRLIIGTGESTIEAALQGQLSIGVAIIALAARVAATLTTITSGGSAGLLFPTLCFGTLVASIWAQVFDVAPATLIVPAMTGSLVSIVNVPLAAILLVIEGFGREYIVPSLFILVAASIVSHETSIYRTQRESFDQNEILPGFGVRRIPVPERWVGRDLRALAIRQRYGVTVIGMIDRTEEANGRVDSHVLLNPRADHDLTSGDVLIVLGETERVEAMEKQLIAIATAEVDGHPDDAPPSLRNAPFSDAEGPFSRSPESLDRALDTDDEA